MGRLFALLDLSGSRLLFAEKRIHKKRELKRKLTRLSIHCDDYSSRTIKGTTQHDTIK